MINNVIDFYKRKFENKKYGLMGSYKIRKEDVNLISVDDFIKMYNDLSSGKRDKVVMFEFDWYKYMISYMIHEEKQLKQEEANEYLLRLLKRNYEIDRMTIKSFINCINVILLA